MFRTRQVRRIARYFSTKPGITITNKSTILKQIDVHLPESKHKGTIEYIFTKPAWSAWFKRVANSCSMSSQSAQNPYGHSLIRFKTPHYDIIMNISGKGDKLVNFFVSDDYLFGEKSVGNPQGGISQRSFVSVRCDNIDTKTVDKLHDYYKDLDRRSNLTDSNKAEFTLATHMLTNSLRPLFHASERGNCAYWTGNGLVNINLIGTTSNWPLVLWFKLLLNQLNTTDAHKFTSVVAYKSINFREEPKGALLYPFYWLKHSYKSIWNLDKFADVVVEAQKKDTTTYFLEITDNLVAKSIQYEIYKDLSRMKAFQNDICARVENLKKFR